MPSPFISESVVIVNPSTEASPYGGSREDWDSATRTTAFGYLAQSGGDEAADNARTQDDSSWALVLRGNPPLTQDSRVEARGEVFRVKGRPKRIGPRGRVHHIEARLVPLGEA